MKLIDIQENYFKRISATLSSSDIKEKMIANECVFLDTDTVLSVGKDFGNSRYPYSRDGLTVWANSSGNITVEESILQIFPDTTEGREPRIAFFAGEACEGGFLPISLTGVARQLTEGNVKRYTVFTPYATYYLTESKTLRSCVRVFLDKEKRLSFSVSVKNCSDTAQDTYISAYFNPLLQTSINESESKWYKKIFKNENSYSASVIEAVNRNLCIYRYAEITRSECNAEVTSTTSHSCFTGAYNAQISSSKSLADGKIDGGKTYTVFNETAVVAEIAKRSLAAGESFDISYTVAVGSDADEVKTRAARDSQTADIDRLLQEMAESENEIYKTVPKISFDGVSGIDSDKLNCFLNNVFKQAEFCARAKNYAGPYIGIRDIFQQLEASLMWIPEYSKNKIVEALGFIGEDGRPPRQYSYPQSEHTPPAMDIRPYIDQGNWIITTVYEYLCFTGDFSILDEVCGYYKIGRDTVDFSERRDSVLCHLIQIVDYLLDHIDSGTNCLRAMYGDWNDALDGLGRTEKPGSEYGNGVSVMATLHLYQNLAEITAILAKLGGHDELVKKYADARMRIGNGIMKHAVVEKDGERRVIHGWGEDMRYRIGSFSDNDGESRCSLTSNAFFVLSDALSLDKTMKGDILNSYKILDSKYGLKTFEPYFARSNLDVGRITKLPKGTAENGATYIHATLFAIWSLFRMGESRLAWEQIYKIMPITHSFISTTPFVMPNSYIHNEEEHLDGESMSDWFTGSGCVLTKVIVREVFGIEPTLDEICITPAGYIPAKKASFTVSVKGCKITVNYQNLNTGTRSFKVNGNSADGEFDKARDCVGIRLTPDTDYIIDVID